jgi:hypothetical protein
MSSYLRRPYAWLVRHRYKLLLASLLLLVLGSGFAPAAADPHVFAALLLQNLAVGVLVFAEEKPLLLVLCLLAVVGLEVGARLYRGCVQCFLLFHYAAHFS